MAAPPHPTSDMATYSVTETAELVSSDGIKKGNSRPDKVFLAAISGGSIISFGCAVSLTALTAPWYQENAPGLIKIIGAAVFPLGLVTIFLTGAELFTSTNMYTMVAVLHGRLPLRKMLLHWFLCFFGNFAGCLFVMAVLVGSGGMFDSDVFKKEIVAFATKKQLTPAMHQIFIRAIGCNWLVCLACFIATRAKDLASKVIGMWIPIFAFVALGFDHVVANMFFIPLGIWYETPDLTIELYIWKGIIPALFGNILGGSLFCGVYFWWMYLEGKPAGEIEPDEKPATTRGRRGIFSFYRREVAKDEESRIEED